MADLTRAAGEPITITLGGKTLTLSPITMGDLAAFERHAKEERLNRFIKAAEIGKLTTEDRLEGITRILTIPFTPDDFANEMGSPDGIRFLLWCSLKKQHTKITLEQVDQFSNLDELMTAVTAISSLGRMAESPPAEKASA